MEYPGSINYGKLSKDWSDKAAPDCHTAIFAQFLFTV